VVQFHHNTGSFKAGQRVRAGDVLSRLKEARPKHFTVFTESSIDLAAGDTVRITANGKTADEKHKLNNGAVYRLAGFTSDGNPVLSNGWTIDKEFAHIAYGYVGTPWVVQGRSAEHTILVQSAMSRPASSREGFYVAASRGRKSVTVYTDDKQDLKEAVQQSGLRLSATELAGKPKPRPWQRMKEALALAQIAAMVAAKKAAHELDQISSSRRRELDYSIGR
jgi:hypothetical protein